MSESRIIKVVLCNPPYERRFSFDLENAPLPPMGIMLLASVLLEAGHEVVVINGAAERDWRERLLAETPDAGFVGLSVMSTQVTDAAEISREIKRRHPHVGVVWGGFHCSIFPDQTASWSFIDLVVRGEADQSILDVAEHYAGRRLIAEVRGVTRRDAAGQVVHAPAPPFSPVDDLPFIDYGLVDRSLVQVRPQVIGDEVYRFFPLLTGLGCCYRCSFCQNALQQKPYRHKSADRILDEMKRYADEFNARHFFFVDEDFFISRKRLARLLDLLEGGSERWKWSANCRAIYIGDHYLSDAMLARLRASGCVSLSIGAESGSQRILEYLNKKQTPEQIINAARAFSRAGIAGTFSFMTALPTETRAEMMETVKLVLGLQSEFPMMTIIGPQCFRPYPGSPLYQKCLESGMLEPKTLEDWAVFDGMFSHFTKIDFLQMPWVPVEDRDYFRRRLYALYALNLGRGVRQRWSKKALGFLLDCFKDLQRFRLQRDFFTFDIEAPIMKIVERRLFS